MTLLIFCCSGPVQANEGRVTEKPSRSFPSTTQQNHDHEKCGETDNRNGLRLKSFYS